MTGDGKVYLTINEGPPLNTQEMMNMAQITTAEFATELNTDAKTARKFLRSITPKDEQPGKGSRWAIDGTKRNISAMRKQFNEWSAKQAEEKAARAAEEAAQALEVEDAELDD